MPKNQPTNINLTKLFGAVTKSLTSQRKTLNQADTYNNDHGDHMVEIFEVITQAMKEKQKADPADQLAYASEILRRRQSGSAQVYANGLAQASQQFQGKAITTDNAGMLLQTLLGGGQAPAASKRRWRYARHIIRRTYRSTKRSATKRSRWPRCQRSSECWHGVYERQATRKQQC